MATTSNLGITLVEQSQAQKEVTINQALVTLDTMIGNAVMDKDLSAPPSSPAVGASYIVAASPTGAWSGKQNQIAYFDQIWRFIVPQSGMRIWVRDESADYRFNGTAWVVVSSGGGGGGGIPLLCHGRLTLTSDVPVTIADVNGASAVYFTPYKGNQITLYSAGAWSVLSFSEVSISLASGYTAGKCYDVFAYNNSGSLALETVVWTNDTTRATALATQSGVWVKSGDATRRYLGTFFASSNTTTDDAVSLRLLYNAYNQEKRILRCQMPTASWIYNATTVRASNANTTFGEGRLGFIIGETQMMDADLSQMVDNGASAFGNSFIGFDSTTTSASNISIAGNVNTRFGNTSKAQLSPVAGFHYLQSLESCNLAATTTFYGSTTYHMLSSSIMA
jgi:hypothetical protein